MQFTLYKRKAAHATSFIFLVSLLTGCANTLPTRSKAQDILTTTKSIKDTSTAAAQQSNPVPLPEVISSELQDKKTESLPIQQTSRQVFTNNLTTQPYWGEPRVEKQFQRYSKQSQFSKVLKPRWELYYGYVLSSVQERGLPSELAVVPVVESMLNPYAFSPGSAAGLWQFLPATARENGLTVNRWYDGRRDPILSTEAALNYLEKLHKRFDDWLIALAAYNAGPARIQRAMNRQASTSYWDLKLPRETTDYVARIIAMSKYLADSEKFKLHWPSPEAPAFVEVVAQAQINLSFIALQMQISTDDIYRYNPGLNRGATPPTGPHRLLVKPALSEQLADVFKNYSTGINWHQYPVKNGDSLSEIAATYVIDLITLKTANKLTNDFIRAGDIILVPGAHTNSGKNDSLSNPFLYFKSQKTSKHIYTVVAGDSFWSIAQKFKVNMHKLITFNRLSAKKALQVGQRIVI
ncbi:MAG: transglycosylase SLT domain-containing protein [Pseudomonadales bacterium]|nr:transglycosylase SLT domain-containing protein [Pseudomonadales bacterium]